MDVDTVESIGEFSFIYDIKDDILPIIWVSKV